MGKMKDLMIQMEEAEHFGETDVGCDIHYIIEKQHKDTWVGIQSSDYSFQFTQNRAEYDPLRNRNYAFFAAIAGVRGAGPEPLGLPLYPSDLTRYVEAVWGADGHSWSYMPFREFLWKWTQFNLKEEAVAEAARNKLEGKDWLVHIFPQLWLSDDELDQYRVVFFFDN